MKIKTAELTGAALDWAVAKCEGEEYRDRMEWDGIGQDYPAHKYSTNWAQGGPIIERGVIDVISVGEMNWRGRIGASNPTSQYGPTPLIAAMRCYVASKLGDTVEIPKELI